MAQAGSQRFHWAGLPLIATVPRLLCRELTLQNEYLRLENGILKPKIKGRLRFTDDRVMALRFQELTPISSVKCEELVRRCVR